MECKLLILSILVFSSHSVVSSIDEHYSNGQYQPQPSLIPRNLLHSNPQNVNYQPSTNPPHHNQEIQQEQWFTGHILPQQQQQIRPQLINIPPQNYYPQVPLQVSYSHSTPTHSTPQPNIPTIARPQDILNTQQKQDLPSTIRPIDSKVLQQHSKPQLGNNQQIEGWWSGQKLQPETGVIGQVINPNTVNAYPETNVHYGSYEYRYPQYQMAAQMIPNTINNYNSYGQRWPHQNQYLHSNLPVSNSESYPKWSEPGNQYLAPRGPQIGEPYSGYAIQSHQQQYPIATEVSEDGLDPKEVPQSVHLGQLGQSKQPGKTGQSKQPGKPGQFEQPGKRGQFTQTPGQSEQPGKSGQPRKQEQYGQLEKTGPSWPPVKSVQSGKSGKPEQSGQPRKQGQYAQPGKPGQSGQPGKQGQLMQPEKPGQSAQPGRPGQSVQPEKPGYSTEYNKPGQYMNTGKPILTDKSAHPGYQENHAQNVPVAKTQTINSKLTKHYIIVNMNGTFENVDNFDFKNVPNHALAIIEVQDKNEETNIEKSLEHPVDTGINIVPQDTHWDIKEQNESKTGQNYKNLVDSRIGLHDQSYNIHPTTENILNNYFKPENLMPIQSNFTNNTDTNTTLSTSVIKENVESSTDTSYLKLTTTSLATPNSPEIDSISLVSKINDNIDSEIKQSTIRPDRVKSIQTSIISVEITTDTAKPLSKIVHNLDSFDKRNTNQENNTTHIATAHAIDNNIKPTPINVETVTNRPCKDDGLPLVEFDGPISDDGDVIELEIVPSSSKETFIKTDGNNTSIWYGDDYMVKIIEEPENIPSKAFKVNMTEIEKNGPKVTYLSGKNSTSPAYIETPEGHGTFKLRDDLEIDFENLKTVVDKPVVWFRPDEKFWDKVTKGENSYDSVSLYNVRCQPRVIEKHTTIHHYPNGTEVVELVESFWDSVNDLNPKEVITDKFVRNPGE